MASKFLAVDKLPAWFPLHHWNEPRWNYATGLEVLNLKEPSLWMFLGMMIFNPVFWNLVARNEYNNKTITKLVKSPYVGCYILAATIFSLSAFRDSLYLEAVKKQPAMAVLNHPAIKALAVVVFAAGQTFVLSSMWALGVTGTYLGDYFGILMSHRVTGFPFNVLNDPMYIGSFLSHLGTALWFESPAGVFLSFWVLATYMLALQFEGPFTDKIYSARHKKTSSAPATPRKSSRIAHKKEETYAEATANGLPSSTAATPARRTRGVAKAEVEAASPHVTRSRSKGRGLSSEAE